jgi:hypothetical protein
MVEIDLAAKTVPKGVETLLTTNSIKIVAALAYGLMVTMRPI